MNLKRPFIASSALFLLPAAAMLLAQSAPQPAAQSSANQQSGSSPDAGRQAANQNPLKVGILPFTDATGTGGSDTGKALSRVVQAEFTHSTNVIAYALDLGDVKQEDLDSQKAVAIGQGHHVDAVILATVLQAGVSDSTHGGIGNVFGQSVGGNIHTKKATVLFQGDLFDIATGTKIDSFRVTGTDTEKKVGPTAWTRLGDVTSEDWTMDNNPLAKALQKAVAVLVKDVAADAPKIQTQK